ncbi:MAG: hypothetical protein U1A77_15700 [Pirellulales bacterium]
MKIRLNRFFWLFLMVLLYPIVLTLRAVRSLSGDRKPVYEGTIAGDPLAYSGDSPLLIAVWAEWASVWTAATADIVEQLKSEFAGRCEFAYVEASSKSVTESYGAQIVPVLILRHRGAEVGRFVNTMELAEVRPAIVAIVGESEAD